MCLDVCGVHSPRLFLNVGKLVLLHISKIIFIMDDLGSRHWVIAIVIQVHELYTNQAF